MIINAGVVGGGLIILWAILYTINFGRWAWRQGERRGAAGIWLLAVALVVVPLWLLLRGA